MIPCGGAFFVAQANFWNTWPLLNGLHTGGFLTHPTETYYLVLLFQFKVIIVIIVPYGNVCWWSMRSLGPDKFMDITVSYESTLTIWRGLQWEWTTTDMTPYYQYSLWYMIPTAVAQWPTMWRKQCALLRAANDCGLCPWSSIHGITYFIPSVQATTWNKQMITELDVQVYSTQLWVVCTKRVCLLPCNMVMLHMTLLLSPLLQLMPIYIAYNINN